MTQELAKFNAAGLPAANPEALAKGLSANVQTIDQGGMQYLRVGKGGYWAIGQDDEEPDEGSTWAIIPHSFAHGWACWIDGELVGERMVTYDQPVPPPDDLPDYGGDWNPQLGVIMQCVTGSQEGRQVLYKGTSRGLRSALGAIKNEIVKQIAEDPDNCVPVVELDVDHYTHKKYGKIFVPVLDIVDWMNINDGTTTEAEAPETEEPEEPEAEAKPRRRRRAKTASAESGTSKKKTRRRRARG